MTSSGGKTKCYGNGQQFESKVCVLHWISLNFSVVIIRFFSLRPFHYTRRGACALFDACPVRSMANYMDLSSTDKGAADKTDEVELQVLCLTGEGVTLSVSRSMLGSDLPRLVSEKLQCKPDAKLAVY